MNPDILRPLRDHEGAPPRIDLAAAMAEGRRRRRRVTRTLLCAVLVAAVLVAVPAVLRGRTRAEPAIGQHCVETFLQTPAGTQYASAIAIDPTGHYAVGLVAPARTDPVIWHDGEVRFLPDAGFFPATPVDVNSHGDVLIEEEMALSNRFVALVAGRSYMLTGVPAAIGDNGEIVGSVDHGQPAMWRTPAAPPTRLAAPAGWTGTARAIDRDGTLGGTLITPDGRSQAVVWSPAGVLRLIPPPDPGGRQNTELRALRDGVALLVVSGDTHLAVMLYDLRTGIYTRVGSGLDIEGGNTHGQIVGKTEGHSQYQPLLLIAGQEPITLPMSRTAMSADALSISDDGRSVLGTENRPAGSRAVIWHC